MGRPAVGSFSGCFRCFPHWCPPSKLLWLTSPAGLKVKGDSAAFVLESGACALNGPSCVVSPDFPASYGNSQACNITVVQASPAAPAAFQLILVCSQDGYVTASPFLTEEWGDILTIAGVDYSGLDDGPVGLYVTASNSSVLWSSDFILTQQGWSLCWSSSAPEPTHAPTPGPEYLVEQQVLMTIYNATSGRNWVNKDNWGSELSHCEWHSVVCNYQKQVIQLLLGSNGMSGSLPSELVLLNNLRDM